MTSILVTGGAGFIGASLVPKLLSDGHDVCIIDNLHDQVHASPPTMPEGASFIHADVRDLDAIRSPVSRADVIVHLAAETGTGQSEIEIERYVSVNTLGTAAVLQASTEAGHSPQLILASSRAIFGEGEYSCGSCDARLPVRGRSVEDLTRGVWEPVCGACGGAGTPLPMGPDTGANPMSLYGLTKMHQEDLVRHAHATGSVRSTVLRLFNVYGPGQAPSNPYVGVLGTFFRAINDGRDVDLYEDGLASRDFVYVDDVAEAFRMSLSADSSGQIWHIGSGQAVSLARMAVVIGESMGVTPTVEVSGRFRVGDIRHAVADTRNDGFGWAASTPFESGVAAFTSWSLAQATDASIDDRAAAELRTHGILRQADPS